MNKNYLLSDLMEGLHEIERHGGVWALDGLPDQVVKDLDSSADWVMQSAISGIRGLGALLFWAESQKESQSDDYASDAGLLLQLLADVVEISKRANDDLCFIRQRCETNADGVWYAPMARSLLRKSRAGKR